ncbi:MAG: hypothetical protein QW420_06140 [Candidatus Caldarchaeum sp.]
MSEKERLRETINVLVDVVAEWVKDLGKYDPSTREASRVADTITKILGRIHDFEVLLSEEDKDLVKLLSEKTRKTMRKTERMAAACDYLRMALVELEGGRVD